ncbi:MarR family winged helix-turn-helix transcriptional regulator [Altericroceibacterium endophyticum]|uniref:MarR family transcriptional regulator n=1 Tax=Altericroceibacterium endophyticum TaxID=1808508 RepID=A0A6I4T596_9SPHN|nr:MarR family transcriptional regulator [Altericroceibacterium endophyticum]MXO65848.1 MarR family transcriptional regulator [Altericroceibacterium endophyticum]
MANFYSPRLGNLLRFIIDTGNNQIRMPANKVKNRSKNATLSLSKKTRLPMVKPHPTRFPEIENEGVDFGILLSLSGFSTRLAWILGRTLLDEAIAEPGVTPQRFSLLEVIGCNPGLTQKALADALGISGPAASVMIDFWTKKGYAERRTVNADRRSFGIFLTKEGETGLAELRDRVLAADAALTANLTADEIRQFRSLLAKLHYQSRLAP